MPGTDTYHDLRRPLIVSKIEEAGLHILMQRLKMKVFDDPDDVMRALEDGRHPPHALLIDVFFYESKVAEEVEKVVTDVVGQLRNQWFARDEYARGIKLMELVADKIKAGDLPPFVRYAYTTKAPYLLELDAWKRIHDSGAGVLIKNSLVAGDERIRLREDIKNNRESWQSKVTKGVRDAVHLTNVGKLLVGGIVSALAGGIVGYLLKSWLSAALC